MELLARTLLFSFGSGVTFGPGRERLFRHAVPGCFPDSKGVFWLAFCAWDSGIACQNLDNFSFGSGVTFGPGKRPFRHAMPGCVPDSKGVLWLGFCAWSGIACQILDFFIRFKSDVWPGQRDGRRLFRHAVPGCFRDSKGVFWLAFCAWNSGFACQNLDVFIGSGVTFGRTEGRQSRRATMFSLCLEQLPARPLIFSCQGVFLI